MTRALGIPFLLAVLVLGFAGRSSADGAPPPLPTRFAGADTSLYRDTLDLKFDRVFVLADSMIVLGRPTTPDSLRALAIRYAVPLVRVLALADSMHVPVDSVGPVLDRERYNPLAAHTQDTNDFRYNSGYTIGQTSSNWVNGSDYNLQHGALFVRNVTNISLQEYDAGKITTKRQQRSSNTELGWRVSPGLSLGGRANLTGFASLDKSIYGVTDNSNEFQLSVRGKQAPAAGVTSELNFFSGVLDETKSNGGKRGVNGDLSGRMVIDKGTFLSHDLDGQLTGNLAHTTATAANTVFDTKDYSGNLRGTLAMYQASPVALNVNYTLRRSRVQSLSTGTIPKVLPVLTSNRDADATVRLRLDNDHYLNVGGQLGHDENSSSTGLGSFQDANALTINSQRGWNLDGRYLFVGWALDAHLTDSRTDISTPKVSVISATDTIQYHEAQNQRSRGVDATLTRPLGISLTLKLNGTVSLDSYDYGVDNTKAQATLPRDQYHQSWRVEGNYQPSDRMNTGVTLEVARTLLINISSANSVSNTETRSYRGEWRWNFRLLPGLTSTQRDAVSADYDFSPFQSGQNRLSLDYSTVTTLNAIITPRLTLDVTHNGRYQPRGTYNLFPDNQEYFAPSDESKNYILSTRIVYTPAREFSIQLSPEFYQFNRLTRQNGVTSPQSIQRNFNFAGGANLNMPVGGRGRLTGNISRSFTDTRTTTYTLGVPILSPRSEQDFWNGSLQFSWQL